MNKSDTDRIAPAERGAPAHVRLSRTETEALCLKATRGAGYSWGIAEEAGAATGWLCANGVDGTDALLAVLDAPGMTAPEAAPENWSSPEGRALCPLLTGAALVDFAPLPGGPLHARTLLGPVRQPVLLLPFLSACAEDLGTSVQLEWSGHTLLIGQAIHATPQAIAALTGAALAVVTIARVDHPEPPAAPAPCAVAQQKTVQALEDLALRTTVPASDASRNSGAGAGTSDND